MLILLSPAKSLDFKSPLKTQTHSLPHFTSEIKILSTQFKKLSTADLEKMMGISEKLSQINFERFQNFSEKFDFKNSRQAILAFDGDVYSKIEKENYSEKDFEFAQNHVRILSGLYGLLKPLDLIQPYRLEMGTDLKNSTVGKNLAVKNLYQFWGDKISNYLNETIVKSKVKNIINLASEEYFLSVKSSAIKTPITNIVFKEEKNGKLKIIGMNAKRARGMMTNFVIKNKITDVEKLKKFKQDGYNFNQKLSQNRELVFTR